MSYVVLELLRATFRCHGLGTWTIPTSRAAALLSLHSKIVTMPGPLLRPTMDLEVSAKAASGRADSGLNLIVSVKFRQPEETKLIVSPSHLMI